MTKQRTARSLVFVTVASFTQLLIQFLIQSVLARYFGTKEGAEAWGEVLPIPTMFAAVISGTLGYVMVPELVKKFESSRDSRDGWQLAWFIGLAITLVGLLVSGLLFFCAGEIVHFLYSELTSEQAIGRSRLLKILSIQVALSGLIAWAQAVLHSRHQFFWPALGGVLGTGLQLALAIRLGPAEKIEWIAWTVNVGSAVSVLVHIVPLSKHLCWPAAEWTQLVRVVSLFWPLLLGSAFLRVDPIVDRVLVRQYSTDEYANNSHLNYAQRILMAVIAIGTSGMSVVAFPQLAEKFARAGKDSFAEHFAIAFRRLMLLVVPIALGVSCFAERIVRDLLERDQFTSQDSHAVGLIIVCSMGMFVGASVGELFARAFYVLGDTWTPTLTGVLSLIIGIFVKFALVLELGVLGIAVGGSVYFLSSATMMAIRLMQLGYGRFMRDSLATTVQSLCASAVACACCYAVYVFDLGATWLAAPMGVCIYFSVMWLLNNSDTRQMISLLRLR
ncbi:MAG: hypothetical protein KDB22_03455 [Planctomycetales bacterium]|nr:hypothetical protein [Planctomycetales bacterium]